MQLSKNTIDFLSRVIKVAKILKIEHIIVDNECVRGHNQDEGSMIIHNTLPTFEFSLLGLSRVDILNSRLSLLGNDVVIEAEEKGDTPATRIISKLIMSQGKTEVEFKCANPTLLQKAPRVLKDPVYFTFSMSQDTILLLQKSQSAFKGETISLVGSKNSVMVKLSDIEGDMMNHLVTESLTVSTECDKDKFYFSYKTRVLLSLLKDSIEDDQVVINITRRGILNLKVLGINVYIAPEL